jgi:hypothetical protein
MRILISILMLAALLVGLAAGSAAQSASQQVPVKPEAMSVAELEKVGGPRTHGEGLRPGHHLFPGRPSERQEERAALQQAGLVLSEERQLDGCTLQF